MGVLIGVGEVFVNVFVLEEDGVIVIIMFDVVMSVIILYVVLLVYLLDWCIGVGGKGKVGYIVLGDDGEIVEGIVEGIVFVLIED